MQITLTIEGLKCTGCANNVETALNAVPGVVSAKVNFNERTALIDGQASVESLLAAVVKAGYQAAELTDQND